MTNTTRPSPTAIIKDGVWQEPDGTVYTNTDPTSTDILLVTRGKTHGDFTNHARISQRLKALMREEARSNLTMPMQESLEMIAHKIGRILAGDPDFRDHWNDIAGYARLVADRCSK